MGEAQVLFLVSGLGTVVAVRLIAWRTFVYSLIPKFFSSAQLWS